MWVAKNAHEPFCPNWHHTGHEWLPLWEETPYVALLHITLWLHSTRVWIDKRRFENKYNTVERFQRRDSSTLPRQWWTCWRPPCCNSRRTSSGLATFRHTGRRFSQRRGREPLKVSAQQTPVVPRCNHNSPSFSGLVRTDKRQSHKYTVAPSSSPLCWPVADLSMCRYRSGSSQKWIQTGWHLVPVCVWFFLSNVHVLQGWLTTALQTNCLLWLTLSFVRSVPACGPCHCGLAHGL